MSAINDDIDRYYDLCCRYGEAVRRHGTGGPDCYGTHAQELKSRYEKQLQKEQAGRLGKKVEEIKKSMGNVSGPNNRNNTQKESMMTSMNFPGANKFMDRLFRKADGVVWDLMTGKIGVQTDAGIATIEGEGDDARISINLLDEFGVALPAFAQSTPPDSIKVGDIIYRGKSSSVSFVTGKKENGKFQVMNVDGTSSTWTAPKVSMLGFDSGVMVLRSLMSMLPNGDKGLSSMQGNLLPMIMMMGGTESLDLDKMLPLMLMSQNAGAESGMGSMMQTMLMMQMMGGGKGSKGGSSFFRD
jgi:hypothetical protein